MRLTRGAVSITRTCATCGAPIPAGTLARFTYDRARPRGRGGPDRAHHHPDCQPGDPR